MDTDKLLILIPARGGSKGLPRKNAKSLGDIPLLAWTRQAVQTAGLVNASIILSTDDEEIAALGRDIGLDVPFMRPPELATDETGAVEVALHALDWFAQHRQQSMDLLMWLQPTSPFRPPVMINRALEILSTRNTDAVLGVKPIHRHLGTLFYADEQGALSPVQREAQTITRRQAVRPLYTPNGAMYLIRSDVLRREKTLMPENCHYLEMDSVASLDIDDPQDWAIAEAIAKTGLSWRHNT